VNKRLDVSVVVESSTQKPLTLGLYEGEGTQVNRSPLLSAGTIVKDNLTKISLKVNNREVASAVRSAKDPKVFTLTAKGKEVGTYTLTGAQATNYRSRITSIVTSLARHASIDLNTTRPTTRKNKREAELEARIAQLEAMLEKSAKPKRERKPKQTPSPEGEAMPEGATTPEA
jgi:hypothetical protein